MENLYDLLDVDKNATTKEIKKAYKEKAKVHHPDKGGDEELFKKIQQAYNILSDEMNRKMYDTTGQIQDFSFEDGMRKLFDTYIIPELINIEKTSFEKVNIIKLIDALIFDKLAELTKYIGENKEIKRRLELILFRKRKKNTESEDILAKFFESHIKQAEMSILMLETESEFVKKVRTVMKDYSYNMAEYMSHNMLGHGI
jgi:DnaJ-class molecular chaperone